eukprot:445276_1
MPDRSSVRGTKDFCGPAANCGPTIVPDRKRRRLPESIACSKRAENRKNYVDLTLCDDSSQSSNDEPTSVLPPKRRRLLESITSSNSVGNDSKGSTQSSETVPSLKTSSSDIVPEPTESPSGTQSLPRSSGENVSIPIESHSGTLSLLSSSSGNVSLPSESHSETQQLPSDDIDHDPMYSQFGNPNSHPSVSQSYGGPPGADWGPPRSHWGPHEPHWGPHVSHWGPPGPHWTPSGPSWPPHEPHFAPPEPYNMVSPWSRGSHNGVRGPPPVNYGPLKKSKRGSDRIHPYRPPGPRPVSGKTHRVLAISDGNFSFSRNFIRNFGGGDIHLVATSFEPLDLIFKKYTGARNNLDWLMSTGRAHACHRIDIRDESFPEKCRLTGPCDTVIMNFPHTGGEPMGNMHVVCSLFAHVRHSVVPGGTLLLGLCRSRFVGWLVGSFAHYFGFKLIESNKFPYELYPTYTHVRTRCNKPTSRDDDMSFVFRKIREVSDISHSLRDFTNPWDHTMLKGIGGRCLLCDKSQSAEHRKSERHVKREYLF